MFLHSFIMFGGMILGGCRTAIVYYRAMTEGYVGAHNGAYTTSYRELLNGQAGIQYIRELNMQALISVNYECTESSCSQPRTVTHLSLRVIVRLTSSDGVGSGPKNRAITFTQSETVSPIRVEAGSSPASALASRSAGTVDRRWLSCFSRQA